MSEDTGRRRGPAPGRLEVISLPNPSLFGSASVGVALERRRTSRAIGKRKLSREILSNLLWAACGVNRGEGPFSLPGRTAASASNSQEISLHAAFREGVYRYKPAAHRLAPVVAGDLRARALGERQGTTGAEAPVRLIYVVDLAKFGEAGFQEPGLSDPEIQKSYYYLAYVATGLIAENVYLYAASIGLAAWFHNCNRAELAGRLASARWNGSSSLRPSAIPRTICKGAHRVGGRAVASPCLWPRAARHGSGPSRRLCICGRLSASGVEPARGGRTRPGMRGQQA